MYVARDKKGVLFLFKTKPVRIDDTWSWDEYSYVLDSDMFPNLKWEDEPLRVNLVAVPTQNINLDYEVAKALYSDLPDKNSLTGISLKNRIDNYEKS